MRCIFTLHVDAPDDLAGLQVGPVQRQASGIGCIHQNENKY